MVQSLNGALHMPINRLIKIPGFSIDRVATAAGDDPEVLRLENLDTDLRDRVRKALVL